MKQLAIVYLALTCISIAGCSSTRTYRLYSEEDKTAIVTSPDTMRVLLKNGEAFHGTDFTVRGEFPTDSLAFWVVSESHWPPEEDFRSYFTVVPRKAVDGVKQTQSHGKQIGLLISILGVGSFALLFYGMSQICYGPSSSCQ